MMVLPEGMVTPKLVLVRLHAMPKTTSASCRKWWTALVVDDEPVPRERGWSSGNPLLAGQSGHYRCLEELRQIQKLFGGLGVQDALARVDHRPPGRQQQSRRLGDVPRVSRGPGGLDGYVVQGAVSHLIHGHVARHLQHNRAGPAGT